MAKTTGGTWFVHYLYRGGLYLREYIMGGSTVLYTA